MAVFIANENGDWWGTNGNTNTLTILDTDKLTLAEKIQMLDWYGDGFEIGVDDESKIDEMLEEILCQDKFEDVIYEFGKERTIEL